MLREDAGSAAAQHTDGARESDAPGAPPEAVRSHERTLVLREDPGLGEQLHPARLEAAVPSSVAAVLAIERGSWEPPLPARPAGWLGFLVLDGLFARRVTLHGTTWTELLGPGDVLEPWQRDREINSSCPPIVRFELLAPGRVAVLDRGFMVRMADWPEVTAAVSARLVERTRSLTYALAICGRVGVAERLVLTLRHLADRWGRVTRDGVVLELPGMTHEMLASQVGAARPSVTTALGELHRRGEARRLGPGSWLLRHQAPTDGQPGPPALPS
ncbi:MAG TPA: Crp/Fnr family transcriptional regulator [Thermoleophilaceae bacterium]|nr:Crp/Fnr family transcriptional regulator [Thermoleophilaceae bacterium]